LNSVELPPQTVQKLFSLVSWLAVFTIIYNLAEGVISVYLGYSDETFTLFGFGLDSFIEMISGIGIAHMVFRMKRNPASMRDQFEKTALKITGWCFYALAAGLTATALYNGITLQKPATTFWGVVISLISIIIMLLLVWAKQYSGKRLHSAPILADARCTLVCIYMSVTLLIASGIYELTHLPLIDAAGTFALAWFSFSEGKECFEKVRTNGECACH
jgi:divalent metal cation (Fe/Co/Zn/Cd) transporter